MRRWNMLMNRSGMTANLLALCWKRTTLPGSMRLDSICYDRVQARCCRDVRAADFKASEKLRSDRGFLLEVLHANPGWLRFLASNKMQQISKIIQNKQQQQQQKKQHVSMLLDQSSKKSSLGDDTHAAAQMKITGLTHIPLTACC